MDPIARCGARLRSAGVDQARLDAVRDAVDGRIARAVERARAAAEPRFAEALADVYTAAAGG